jgi:regulator of sigma E protease
VGAAGVIAVDIGLMLAAMAEEPGVASWFFLKVLAWLGVAAGLTFVIFVHELGHFLVAKACGVKCEKFYVGFDFFEFGIPFTKWKIPRSLVKFQWGETEYGIGSLPLGGYVKMLGQDDDPRNAEHEAARIRAAAPAVPEAKVEAIATGAVTEGLIAGQPVEMLSNEALAHPHHNGGTKPEEPPVPAQTTEGKTILLDPHSYPAKTVPARMAIISAGVIMNLIFAVILAAVAYRLGVQQMPAIVGSTSPGAAAWAVGIEPGSKIIQIGRQGEPYESLRWGDIRTTAVLNNGQEVPLLVRKPNGEEVWYEVRPTRHPDSDLPLMGIGVPRKAQIEIFPEHAAHLNPRASQPLQDFDKIVEAAGQKVTSGADLTAIFAQQPLGELAITIERSERTKSGKPVEKSTKPPEVLNVVLAAMPMRELGLTMKAGPITAVQAESPAAKAGLQIDDLLIEVNGQPVGDPLSLSQRLTPQSGDTNPVTVVVERKDRQGQVARRTFSVAPHRPLQSSNQMGANPISLESVGIALEVTTEVVEVAADGPAAQAGLQPGDVVTGVQFVEDDPKRAESLGKILGPNVFEPVQLGAGKKSWPEAVHILQMVPTDTKVMLTWTRAGKSLSQALLPRDSTSFFRDNRGVTLYVDLQPHIAANWSEAAALGFREARDQLTQVLTILHRLVTGRLSATNLSGPFGIIHVAGSFASQGVSSLLLFLTMLSANLAVLNFLPIPALDGGHMLFLSAEAVRGKPVDERLQIRLTIVGVICLLSLMVFATAMDLNRFIRFFG